MEQPSSGMRQQGTELLTLFADFDIFDVAFSPDGKSIAAAVADGSLVLWESTAPDSGYEPRKYAESARKLVEKLYGKSGFYRDVISELQSDAKIDPDIRRMASNIANSNKWEDAENLRWEAWATVSLPDKDVAAYQVALEKASKANALEPNDPTILTTLGAAQYRVGSYEDALKTLAKSEWTLYDAGEESDPWNLAFKAMTLHKIGRAEQTNAALEQLRQLCQDEEYPAWDMDVQGLLAEAEKLIVGEEQ